MTATATRKDRTKALLADLEAGIDRLVTSDEWHRYLATAAKFHHYSFGNILLILAQRQDATQVAGFHKWIDLGRHVRKGEHGIWILAPITRKVEDDETGETSYRLVGYKSVPVFDISQTDGEPLPEPAHLLTGDAPEGLYKRLVNIASDLGFPVEDSDTGQANGVTYYATAEKDARIAINPDREPLHRAKTLAHEIAHAILHGPEHKLDLDRGQIELEAESTAFVVLATLGIDSGDYSFGYVTGWADAEQDADKARTKIRASAARIQAAATQILDALDGAE